MIVSIGVRPCHWHDRTIQSHQRIFILKLFYGNPLLFYGVALQRVTPVRMVSLGTALRIRWGPRPLPRGRRTLPIGARARSHSTRVSYSACGHVRLSARTEQFAF